MSTDSLSDAQPSAKDSGLHNVTVTPTIQTANLTTNSVKDIPLPLEAAQTVVAEYIKTLHFGLQPIFSTLTQACLAKYNAYYNHTTRARELDFHPQKIPPSVRSVKFILQPLDEQIGSEGYQALQSDLTCEMDSFRRKLIDKFVIPFNRMKLEAYLKRFHLEVCKLLREGMKGFMYQLNLIDHNVDQIIIDFLTSKPPNLFSSPLPTDISSFLTLYKEANKEITYLPLPTNNNAELCQVIENINTGLTNTTSLQGAQFNSNTLNTELGGHSPPSSITTSVSEGASLQPIRTGFETSITQTLTRVADASLPTPRDTLPTVTPGTSLPASDRSQPLGTTAPTATPATALALPQAIQSPYVIRTRQQQVTPRNESLPLPPAQDTNIRPLCSNVGINGTPFFSAQTLLVAQQMTNSLMSNLENSRSPFTADESAISQELTDSPNDNNFSSQPEFTEADLTSITTAINKNVLQTRIAELYTKAVLLPIKEFLTTVTAREELLRIRQFAAPTTQNSLSAKVAEKIQSERPADRATLKGLINEEQEKSTAAIRQRLQSVLHKLDRLEQQQKQGNLTKQRQPAKKAKGGNTNQAKDGTRKNEASTVAAVSSASNTKSSIPPSPPPTQAWGRKRPKVSFSKPIETNSVTVDDSVSTAPKQKRAKHWKRPQRKTPQY
jgi:hypothetical protein